MYSICFVVLAGVLGGGRMGVDSRQHSIFRGAANRFARWPTILLIEESSYDAAWAPDDHILGAAAAALFIDGAIE
jgi:hypothetical protein